MRILLVGDNAVLSDLIKSRISKIYAVDLASNLSEAYSLVDNKKYHLIIFDLVLSDEKICSFCNYLKENNFFLIILFLTAELDLCKKLFYLRSGNDYFAKPFNIEELEAKIKFLLQKHYKNKPLNKIKSDLEICLFARKIFLGGVEIKLNRKEFLLLELLFKHDEQIFSKTALAEHIWTSQSAIEGNTIETTISSLRKKLGKDLIKTVKGVGYSLKKD